MRGHDNYDLEDVPLKKIFPSISVQVFPLSILREILGAAAKMESSIRSEPVAPLGTESLTTDTKLKDPDDTSDKTDQISSKDEDSGLLTHMVNAFSSDITGVFFISQLDGLITMAGNPHVTFNLRNIQKVGPVLYAQVVLKLDKIVVNHTLRPQLFIVREYYVISTGNNLLILQTTAVSEWPSFVGGYFDYINQWLSAFYLAEK